MRTKIERQDIMGPRRYASVRDEYRARVIAKKKLRRVIVGDRVSLVFENFDTLTFQIEEMLRAESISEEDKVQEEIDVYNTMMPAPGELSATLFLENPPGSDAKTELHRFIGIDEHVTLIVGPHRVRAAFEEGRQEGDRISAVQYTRYKLPEDAVRALATPGTPVAVEIMHPSYRHTAHLTDEMRSSLAEDLA